MDSDSNKRVVITGANGSIGRSLVRRSLDRGWEVVALSRRTEWLESLSHPRLTVRAWELHEVETAREIFQGGGSICHLAATLPPDMNDPAYAARCLQDNAIGTLELLQLSVDSGAERFVYFSAGNAYAPAPEPATEDSPLYPAHRAPYYLSSKITGEVYTEHFRQVKGLPATILRVASVYGPEMKTVSLVPRFLQNARRHLPIELHEGGRYTVDLVSAEDVAEAALLAMEKEAEGIFNIGSGRLVTTLEVAEIILRILSQPKDLLKIHPPSEGGTVAGFSAIDISKARRELGFAPLPLEEGLRRTAETLFSSG